MVCTPSPPPPSAGGLSLHIFKKKNGEGGGGDLTGSQFLGGGCWERGGDFFRGVAIFT